MLKVISSKATTTPLFSLKQIEKIISGTDDFIFLLNAKDFSLVAVNESGHSFLTGNTSSLLGKDFSSLFPSITNYLTQQTITINDILRAFKKANSKNVYIISHNDSGNTYELAMDKVKIDTKNHYLFIKMRDVSHRITSKEETIRFVHTIGHELKQPLSLIKAYSYYIKRNVLPKQSKLLQYPEKIDQQVDILTSMLNDIVDTTKLSTQEMPINKEPTELISLVNSVLTDIIAAYPSRHFVLNAPNKINLFADPLRLRQGIMNLCMNSVKYSDENTTITITISKNDHSIILQITDQGIGIPKEDFKKIFNPYFRTSFSKKKAAKGLGLGLALVKEVVKLHDGTISVDSTLNHGSTFTLEFPLKQ